jgi:hypothetical protein
MDQNKWITDMLGMVRVAFNAGAQGMEAFQGQAKKTVEATMSNADNVQDEAKKALSMWLENVEEARKAYMNSIEEGLNSLEQQFSSIGKTQKK